MGVELYRIDDRLIHGQVVVGWGQPMGLGFIALVDDEVAASDWEQELYRMGVPPEMDVFFASLDGAARELGRWREDQRPGILLTGDVETMMRLVEACSEVRAVNLGGIHHRADRTHRLRYVYLSRQEEALLRQMAARGVTVTAQDVPSARPVPLDELLHSQGSA
ncbi:MAG TPA: PTS sugar transporter subunit IIB [Gemmatimonadaceae bacterium]|nr:PTS sugar transporter subunit IIB [Gemmatimonadaceae bacterium]